MGLSQNTGCNFHSLPLQRTSGSSKFFVYFVKMSFVNNVTKMMQRIVGRRRFEQANNWVPTLGVFGAAGAITVCWATDWKLVMGQTPFYGSKFDKDSPK